MAEAGEILIRIKLDEPLFEWLNKIGGVIAGLGDELQKTPQSREAYQLYKDLVVLIAECPLYANFEKNVQELLDVTENASR